MEAAGVWTTLHFQSRHLFNGHLLSIFGSKETKSTLVEGVNCTAAAYLEFPTDIFSDHSREVGAILFHITVVVYIFTAMAIICDDYFVPSLGRICEILGFSEDVAGATFMAAGSSAPELFTSIIGVFVAKGDVGTGTIVGSAVFNLLCIVGLCGVVTTEAIYLNWWPLVRDAGFYAVSIVALILVIYDGFVTWWESMFMLVLYSLYILTMKYNNGIREWVLKKLEKSKVEMPLVQGGVAPMILVDTNADYASVPGKVQNGMNRPEDLEGEAGYQRETGGRPSIVAERAHLIRQSFTLIKHPIRRLNIWETVLLFFLGSRTRRVRPKTRFLAFAKLAIIERRRLIRLKELSPVAPDDESEVAGRCDNFNGTLKRAFSRQLLTEDPDLPGFDDWKIRPSCADTPVGKYLLWWFMSPIKWAFYITIPDCRKSAKEHKYLLTFGICIVWIAFLSYIMVWMVTIIGYTLGIPDSIMGITFLAAGSSIPDCMASIIVAKQGQGNMAVSNSVGSNVFDILLGLAFPWFLKTAIVSPGHLVRINSNGLIYSVLLLFLLVGFLVGGVHLNGRKLDRRLGTCYLVLYVIFMTISCLIEANVFGFVNMPNCPAL